MACWAGPVEEGERRSWPFRDVAPVVAEHVGPMPYPALNGVFDALCPPGLQHYWKANFVTELTDDAIAAHLKHGPEVPTVHSTAHLPDQRRGASRRPGGDGVHATGTRTSRPSSPALPDPADNDANIAWVRDYYDATAPHSEEGGYVNFMSGDDQDRIRANYGANYDRLVEVKRTYDPDNLFHLNQNIAP